MTESTTQIPAPPHSAPPAPKRPRFQRSIASVRNVAASYAGTAAESVVFLLLTPFLVRHLGLVTFGLWGLAVSLTDWIQLLDFGLREAILKFTAAHQARADAPAVRRLADAALWLYVLASLLSVVAGVWLARFVLPALVARPQDLTEVQTATLLLAVSAAISFPAGAAGAMLEGLARFDLLNLFRVGHAILRLVFIVMALSFGMGIVGVAASELAARLFLHAWRWIAIYRIDRELVPRPRRHAEELRGLLGFGAWSGLRNAAEVAAARLYEPMVAALAGVSAVGAFYAGRRLASTSAEVVVPMAGVLVPLSSEMEASGRHSALRRTLLSSTKAAVVVGLPIAMLLGIGAHPILLNWLGGRAPDAEPVLAAFSAVFLLTALMMPSEAMLLGLGRTRLLAVVGLSQIAITIALGIPLTKAVGPAGLALAALVGVALAQVGGLIPIAARGCGLGMGALLRKAVLPPLVAAVPAAVVLLLLRSLAQEGLAGLGAWASAGMGIYVFLLWWIGFDHDERAMLRTHLGRLIQDPADITDWEDSL